MAPKIKGERKDTPKATLAPTMAMLGWAAGFLEGEGAFGGNFHKPSPSQIVRATQKDFEPLRLLQKLFGGRIYHRRNDGFGEWRATGVRARGVMFTMFPFLSARRRTQIKVALGGAL